LCQTDAKKFVEISLETREVTRTFKPEAMTGDFMALHPSGKFIVTRADDNLLGIVRVDSGEISKASFPRTHKMEFSRDGKLLFSVCGDLSVYVWEELLAAGTTMTKPMFAARSGAMDMVLDHTQNRVLFSSRENKIEFLNLDDKTRGVLLDWPDKAHMEKLSLSVDRKFLCFVCVSSCAGAGHRREQIQVWNYGALCKAAGLE